MSPLQSAVGNSIFNQPKFHAVDRAQKPLQQTVPEPTLIIMQKALSINDGAWKNCGGCRI
jgi:hypothetical protein